MRPLIAVFAIAPIALSLASIPLAPSHAAVDLEYPSFMEKGAVFCTDELDYAAWEATGRFHTRGGRDSCVQVDRLTRVALMNRTTDTEAEIRVVSGPLDFQIGWTNAPLPVVPSS